MYETMAVWQSMGDEPGLPAVEADFAEVWRGLDKVVYSRTLDAVWTPRTRLEREFEPGAVRRMKEEADRDISVSGPDLAQHRSGQGSWTRSTCWSSRSSWAAASRACPGTSKRTSSSSTSGASTAAWCTRTTARDEPAELSDIELGFDSWVELKEATPMSAPTTSSHANELRLQRALGVVFVTNFERALTFYCDKLGFEIAYTYGEPPFWGEVRRDDIAFNLRHVDDSPWLPGLRDDEQLLSLSVTTTDAKALFVQYQAAGVEFQERLKEKPWKAVEFVVRDPDGNLILFGSPV